MMVVLRGNHSESIYKTGARVIYAHSTFKGDGHAWLLTPTHKHTTPEKDAHGLYSCYL